VPEASVVPLPDIAEHLVKLIRPQTQPAATAR